MFLEKYLQDWSQKIWDIKEIIVKSKENYIIETTYLVPRKNIIKKDVSGMILRMISIIGI